MPRPAVVLALLFVFAAGANAQTFWQSDDDRPRRTERDAAGNPKPAFIPPLSSNTILGRVQRVDTEKRLAILVLDRVPADRTATLVARDADCTPRAVLRQIPLEKRSNIVACKITHGAVTPGMEIVLPAAPLLKTATASLPSHETPPAATPAKK